MVDCLSLHFSGFSVGRLGFSSTKGPESASVLLGCDPLGTELTDVAGSRSSGNGIWGVTRLCVGESGTRVSRPWLVAPPKAETVPPTGGRKSEEDSKLT